MREWQRGVFGTAMAAVLLTSCAWPQTPAASSIPSPAPQRFDVVAIHHPPPDRVFPSYSTPQGTGMHEQGMALWLMIQLAFGLEQNQISAPEWTMSDKFDIEAKTEGGVSLTREQMRPLVQQVLVDRFGLKYHFETKESRGYALVVAKGGLKMEPADKGEQGGSIMLNEIRMPSASMKNLAAVLAVTLHQPVVDQTGVAGNYKVKLSYAREDIAQPDDSSLPSIYTAVQEQLGLKLEPRKIPVKVLVVDHIEKEPTAN
jgi:uncharacterized protein (TIGR03435 family)